MAAMIERKIKNISIILNCENLTDFRQSRKEDLVTLINREPIYTDLWGPTEGRIINLSIKATL
jgi:iron complex outermembrane receptor protein/outer membrane receptor for ferrienterochelin and colicins